MAVKTKRIKCGRCGERETVMRGERGPVSIYLREKEWTAHGPGEGSRSEPVLTTGSARCRSQTLRSTSEQLRSDYVVSTCFMSQDKGAGRRAHIWPPA